MKLFFFDLETTGTDTKACGIHQISGAVVINGQVMESFDYHVRPRPAALIEPKALEVGNVTEQQIMAYPPMEQVYAEVTAMLSKYVDKFDKRDKFYLVGFNNGAFDNQFFREWFLSNGDKFFGSYFWANYIDVYVLATPILAEIRANMQNFRQGTVAKALCIPVDDTKLHDAKYDIDICMKIYKRVCGKY